VSPDDLAELDFFERCAVDRLEPILGTLRLIDRRGAPSGLHDFEADLPGGVAAIEVTGEIEEKRAGLVSAALQRFASFRVPGSALRWDVQFSADADISKVTDEQLRSLLRDIETAGLRSASRLGLWTAPFAGRLAEHRIESVYAWSPQDSSRRGTVIAQAGFYGGRGWDRSRVDAWLREFFSGRGRGKLEKLERARRAAERHLVIMVDLFSPAGVGLPVGLVDDSGAEPHLLPSITPPDQLTCLWVIPTEPSWNGFRWSRRSGWTVLAPAAPGG
jgi:hypothetical protein